MSENVDIKKLAKSVQRNLDRESRFRPTQFQERVKVRFWRRLNERSHLYDEETALKNRDIIIELAGTDAIMDWVQTPEFANWFLDSDYLTDLIASMQPEAVRTLIEIQRSDTASEADRLKATRMLLELGDQFPGRKSEVRFLDDRLNSMSDNEVDKETARLQAQLQLAEKGTTDE